MTVYLEKRVVLGLIAALAVLAGLSVMTFINNKEPSDGRIIVSNTNEVLYHSERLLAGVVDAETGQLGYAVTGDGLFLRPFYQSVSSINNHFETLVKFTADNLLQQLRLSCLKISIDQKIIFTTENINLHKERIEEVKRKMETLVAIYDHQENYLRCRTTEFGNTERGAGATCYFSTPQS